MTGTLYTYDVQFTNSNARMLHIYVEAPTNTAAIQMAMTQLNEWGAGGAITRIDVIMLNDKA